MTIARVPNEKRFWAKVKKTRTCWLWLGSVDKDGYGKFQLTLRRPKGAKQTPQKHVRAHRYAFELLEGRAPRGNLLHECDVKSCVRVGAKHVCEGSQKKNVRDGLRRGRSRRCTTPDVVRRIRQECPRGPGVMARMKRVAEKYGLSVTAVQWIVYRIDWKWVD